MESVGQESGLRDLSLLWLVFARDFSVPTPDSKTPDYSIGLRETSAKGSIQP